MNLKSFIHLALAVTFFFSNALAVHSAEANFWSERRVHSKRQYSGNAGVGGEFSGTTGSGESSSLLLAQLPGAQPVGLIGNSSIPSLSYNLPTNPVGEIHKEDLTVAQAALTRDGSADWLDPLVNPYGTVREIHLSKKADSPLIIHIQDVHGYVDAQKNIAGMIDGLAKYREVNLIGMEAAEGAFALEDLRRFPDQDIKERVTNWAIKKDLIGGAEKSGIMAEKPLTLWGMENTELYQSNVQAVKESLARRPEALAFHGDLTKNVTRLKGEVYSEELKKYDDNLLAYQDKRRGLGEYLKHLAGQSPGGRKEMAKNYPTTAQLLNALDQESKLDFKQVELERINLVELLASRLDEKTLNGLVKESMAYRAGRVTYGRYYAYVKDLCRQAKVDLTEFPGLTDYIAYVGLSEKINRYQLLSELERLEDSVAGGLARTELERGVLALSRDSVLLGKLMNNAMTPQDWGRYLTRRGEILNLETRGKTLAKQGGVLFEAGIPQDFAEFVKPFEEFCRLALARNQSLADNLFAKMGKDHIKTAVLVTGGFHTEGLMAEIDRRGGSYVVLTPRVEIAQTDKNYLDAFAHDPVPLEKLFDGEKISILTARTTTEAAQANHLGAFTASFAIRVAELAEAVKTGLAEGKPVFQIQNQLSDYLSVLPGARLMLVSGNGGHLTVAMAGANYTVKFKANGDYTIERVHGPEGNWIDQIFGSSINERQLTKNIADFAQRHGWAPLMNILKDLKVAHRQGMLSIVAKIHREAILGHVAIAFMFASPLMAPFALLLIFSGAIPLVLAPAVIAFSSAYAIAYILVPGFRATLMTISHGAYNVFRRPANQFFSWLGIQRLFPALTIPDMGFTPYAGIDELSIQLFQNYLDTFIRGKGTLSYKLERNLPAGYNLLSHHLYLAANRLLQQSDSSDRDVQRLIADIGGHIVEDYQSDKRGGLGQNIYVGEVVSQNLDRFKEPPQLLNWPGHLAAIEKKGGSAFQAVYAAVYDESVRRYFESAAANPDVLGRTDEEFRGIWVAVVDGIQNGVPAPSEDSSLTRRGFTHSGEVTHQYNGDFTIILSPGNWQVSLKVFHDKNLPKDLKDQAVSRGIKSQYYLVRETKYGNTIVALNEKKFEIGKNTPGFVTLVERGHLSPNHLSISVSGDVFTIQGFSSAQFSILTPPNMVEKTEVGKAILKMREQMSPQRSHQDNFVPWLILRAAQRNGLVSVNQGLTQQEVAVLNRDLTALENDPGFRDVGSLTDFNFKVLNQLATALDQNRPLSSIDLASAFSGLNLVREVQQALNSLSGKQLSLRDVFFRTADGGFRIGPSFFNNARIMEAIESNDDAAIGAFSTYLYVSRDLEMARRLLSAGNNFQNALLPDGVAAYRRLWTRIRSGSLGFPKSGTDEEQSAFINAWLRNIGFKGAEITQATGLLISEQARTAIAGVEGFREDEFDFTEVLFGNAQDFNYDEPFPIILENDSQHRVIYWVYKYEDMPPPMQARVRARLEGSILQGTIHLVAEDNLEIMKLSNFFFKSSRIYFDLAFWLGIKPGKTINPIYGPVYARVSQSVDGRIRIERLAEGKRVIVGRAKPKPIHVEFSVTQINGTRTLRDEMIILDERSKTQVVAFLQQYFGRLRLTDDWAGRFINQLLTMFSNRIIVSVVAGGLTDNRITPSVAGGGITIQLSEQEFSELCQKQVIPGYDNLLDRARKQFQAIEDGKNMESLDNSRVRAIVALLHVDRALWKGADEVHKRATNEHAARNGRGSWNLWNFLGVNSVTGAIFEAVFYLVGATFIGNALIPAGQIGYEMMIPLFFDVTGTVFLALFVMDFLIHFLGGVGQAKGQRGITIWNNATAKAAFRATLTATNNAYMLPFVVGALLVMPFASAAAWVLLVFGFALGAYKHAMANYRIELLSFSSHPAEGVTVMSTPVSADGNLAPAPAASLMGMLEFAFAGGKAKPQYDGISWAVHQVSVTPQGLLAANMEPLASASVTNQPGVWVAQQALANRSNREATAMQSLVAFFNTVAFFASHLAEMVEGFATDAPILIEVPDDQLRKDNPTATESLAAVVMAGMETSSRPMALVTKKESSDTSVEDVVREVRAVLESYSPVAAAQFAERVRDGQIQAIMADGRMLKDDKFQLKEILASAYNDRSINSALVFGDAAHFNANGIDAVFRNCFSLAATFAESFKQKVLFAIQA